MKKVALYTRVSTDAQTTDNQTAELETVAQKHGWHIVSRFEDVGVSGSKGRQQRPGFDALIKGAESKEFDMVVAWSVDRLGRSLSDLVGFIASLKDVGCGLYLHQQNIDTSTPSGMAMFQMCGVFAEFERGMIRDRVVAGMARARSEGVKFGRPRVSPEKEESAREMLSAGKSFRETAAACGIGMSALVRIKSEMKAE